VGAAGRGRAKSGTHGVAAEGRGGGGGWQNFPRVGGRWSQTAATAGWTRLRRYSRCAGLRGMRGGVFKHASCCNTDGLPLT
jgi:hypothetical protein